MDISSNKDNAIINDDKGLYVPNGANLRVSNSNTIQNTLIGGTLLSQIKVNDDNVFNILKVTGNGLEAIPTLKNIIPKVDSKDSFAFNYDSNSGYLNLKTFTGSLPGLVPAYLDGEELKVLTSRGTWEKATVGRGSYYQTIKLNNSFIIDVPEAYSCELTKLKVYLKGISKNATLSLKKNDVVIEIFKLSSKTNLGIQKLELLNNINLLNDDVLTMECNQNDLELSLAVFGSLKFY